MSQSEEDKIDEKLDAVLAEFLRKLDSGEPVDRKQFLAENSELASQLEELLDAADWIERLAGPTLAELRASSTNLLDTSAQPSHPVDRSTDFSVDPSIDPSAATMQYQVDREAISVSNPARVVNSLDSTAPPDQERVLSSSIVRASPENTQHVLPCRFGDYILERILGRGGMGVVYLARQVQLERSVAIKMIRSGCLAGENEIERFYTEARSAARLDHPNIVSVYQCGEIDGHHYFSMDYIQGSDLAKRIQSGPLGFREAARYVRDVALAIAYAHEQGVLHRDLKPANVIIDADDEIIITDFGLAKLMDSDEGLTRSGAALGTPSYMSPEQAAGNADEQSEATDVYALGAILFAILTGQPPFQGATMIQTVMDVIHRPALQVRQLRKDTPLDLDTIVAKCLQKKPTERYPTAQALADELDRFLNHAPIHARPISMPRRAYQWLLHIPIVAALVGFSAASPTPAHRWTQRALIIGILGIAGLFIVGTRLPRWWNDNTLPSHISIAAGDADGAYYSIAGKLSENLRALTQMESKINVTVGSMENVQRLINRESELALLQGTALSSNRVSVVAPLYYEAVHLVVRKAMAARSLADLSNRRIAVGIQDSGTQQAISMLHRSLAEAFQSMNCVEGDWSELTSQPDLDGAFAVVRLGHPGIRELLAEGEFVLLPLPDVQRISLSEPTFRPYELSSQDYETLLEP
jgi:eukaryotic-like serine/threonine-protein kinase